MTSSVKLDSPAQLGRQAEFLRHLAASIPNLSNAEAYLETANTLALAAHNLQCLVDKLKDAQRAWDDLVMDAQDRAEYMAAYESSEWSRGVDLSKHI